MIKYPLITLFLIIFVCLGCETQNPVCSDNYCVIGEIFPRSELGERSFEELPARISEQDIVNLLRGDVGEYTFQPITVSGLLDWNFRSPRWQYHENGIIYLKKVTLEFESDEGRFSENRVILVNLNRDTIHRDEHFKEYVDFLGTGTIRLTHHTGIAEYRGDIVGAPTK